MNTVLHITAAGNHWWQKSREGWVRSTAPAPGSSAPVWVMTDLTEESVAEITVPRVFGADRSRFVERQLASRYPETEFRASLAPRSAGGLMDRLSPPLQTLTGIEPADRVKTALQDLRAPLAGVWSVSMLLTRLGQRSSLPANLFVVHCQGSTLRILYLKDRAPVLTRLVNVPPNPNEQAAEIVRTLRHLENTRVIDRGSQRFAVLLLGGNEELATALIKDRMDCLPLPSRWAALANPQSNDALFDIVCKSPPGQLAPLTLRARYLANNLSRAAMVVAAVVLLLAIWLAAGSVQSSLQAQRDRQQMETASGDLSTQLAQVDTAIKAFGVSPDLVRNALAIDEREISSAPDLRADLVRLATTISAVPGARIKQLRWQVLDANAKLCVEEGAAVAAEPTDPAGAGAAGDAVAPQRKVELQIAMQMPPDVGPRQLALHAQSITRALGGLKGASIVRDPARTLRDGDIRVGTTGTDNQDLQWCASLAAPATAPVAAATPPTGAQP
ncbi:MAG: hypothetical protein H7Y28_03205 [Rhodoferax sp.]|nr:hypothetical protein [Rhodoferax sp.]